MKNLLFLFCFIFSASAYTQENVDEVVEYIINDFAKNFASKPQSFDSHCIRFQADTIITHDNSDVPCKQIVIDVEKIYKYEDYLVYEDRKGNFFTAWRYDFSKDVFAKMQKLYPKKLKLFYDYRNIVIKYEEP